MRADLTLILLTCNISISLRFFLNLRAIKLCFIILSPVTMGFYEKPLIYFWSLFYWSFGILKMAIHN